MPLDGTTIEQRDEVLDLLRQARELIGRRWCQDDFMKSNGAVCLVGALQVVTAGREMSERVQILDAAIGYLRPMLPAETMFSFKAPSAVLMDYNDAPGRTQGEIVALYDAAIARREQTGGTRA